MRDALGGLETARAPFVPLVGAFAARHLQVPVRTLYADAGALAKGLEIARRLTGADAIICLPDTTLLAEACGCAVAWEGSGPAVRAAPAGGVAALDPDTVLQRGRVPVVLDALKRLRHALDGHWGLLAALPGPWALASQLWTGDFGRALAAAEPGAVDGLEAAGRLCTQFAHRLGELELDGCLIMDSSLGPLPETGVLAAPVYATLVNVLAFYGYPTVYHGGALDWIVGQTGAPEFTAFLPAPGAGPAPRAAGSTGLCAGLSADALLASPDVLDASIATLRATRSVLVSTTAEVPADTPIAALQAVAAALGGGA